MTFMNIFRQLFLLHSDEGAVSSDDEFSGLENEGQEAQTSEDRELKDSLLRKYGSHISSLKLEFSKKKKKGKLPKEARKTLLQWWELHYKWPYPTVSIYPLQTQLLYRIMRLLVILLFQINTHHCVQRNRYE